jgi:hypothetical protein
MLNSYQMCTLLHSFVDIHFYRVSAVSPFYDLFLYDISYRADFDVVLQLGKGCIYDH